MALTALAATVVTSRDAEQILGTVGAGGTAIDQANGMSITGVKKANKLVIVWYNSSAGNQKLTLKAGVYPPALDSGEGDYTTAVVATTDLALITVDASRHMQKDGTISLAFDAGSAGRIWAYQLPA